MPNLFALLGALFGMAGLAGAGGSSKDDARSESSKDDAPSNTPPIVTPDTGMDDLDDGHTDHDTGMDDPDDGHTDHDTGMDDPDDGHTDHDTGMDDPNDGHTDHDTGMDDPDDGHTDHDTGMDDPDDGHTDHDTGMDDPDDGHTDHDTGMDDPDDGHTDHDTGSSTIAPPPTNADQATLDAYVSAIRAQPEAHVHDMDSDKMGEHMAAMDLVPRYGASHIAVSDGNWFDSNTWYSGEVPGDDARVLIPEGISVTYDDQSDARLFTVRVDGELDFATDTDSRMVFDTMVVSPSGHLVIGTEDGPVAKDVSVELVIANNGPIDVDWDPMLLSRGIISHGDASIHGAEKDSHEKVSEDPMAGDDTLVFDEIPLGWEIGDTIVVAGTDYDGHKWDNAIRDIRLYESEDEARVITGINGNTIELDRPLEHDHDAPRDDLHTSVANYTRNVLIETENAELVDISERGHVMFMHSDDVDVRYAEFHELGRTDKSEPSQQVSDFDTIAPDSNVQGRYSLHLHRTGVDDLDNPAMVVGNAVWGSPGWGFVHHDSNAILDNNASFDTFGAGYVAETGNETGAWTDNIAILAQGVSWAEPKNTSILDADTFDTGRGGDGFWFQGRLVSATDNIAASVNTGFVYFHRGGDGRTENFDAALFEFSDALWNDDAVKPSTPSIREFSGNESFAAREGLHIVKDNPNQGHDVWSTLDDFTAWNVVSGAHLEYTSHYLLEDFDLIGKEGVTFSRPEAGISVGTNSSEIVILNSSIDGFETGIDLLKSFNSVAEQGDEHNYVVIDTDITNVANEYENYDPAQDRILSAEDLQDVQPELNFDQPLIYDGITVAINGTKTDTIGEEEFPGGTDNFDIDRFDVTNHVETEGFWTTSDGQSYFIVDLYFSDRTSGDVYFESHPVFVSESTANELGNPHSVRYGDAVNNGEQDIVLTNGTLFAGDRILEEPVAATPQTGSMHAKTQHDEMIVDSMDDMDHMIQAHTDGDASAPIVPDATQIWEAITHDQGVWDEQETPQDEDPMEQIAA